MNKYIDLIPKIRRILLIVVLLLTSYYGYAENGYSCEVIDLKCEYLTNPLGIDETCPRLTWRLADNRQNAHQTAFRLIVGTDSVSVQNDLGNMWDTGKQEKTTVLTTYTGKQLSPLTRYYWKIIVWDKDKMKVTSSVASFETGMMGMYNWKGAWISDHHDINYKPAPYFRKIFNANKKIQSARAYIAVAGLYELSLNGKKVGNHRLDPMYTRFDRRNLYVTYDVTSYLQEGTNAIGVVLGNGWYNHQSLAVWDFDRAPWRARPAFCMDLHITYADGTVETIVSERDWKTSSGPIIFNSIYTAEHYDARLEITGWDTVNFDDSAWQDIRYRSVPSANVVSQQIVPIRNVKAYTPISMKKINSTVYIFDMGQNMSGVSKVNIKGEAGTVVKIRHSERIDINGRADMSNIDVYYRGSKEADPFQTDILILSGKKEDEFMAKFNYKGFRYIEIESDKPLQLTPANVTAYFMHSDVNPVGNIKTSSPMVNDLWRVTNNAYLSNLMGYPTDCPQREKNGWTGDGHLAIETALYNFDGITVYEKWLADHRDEQQPNGVLPDIIPTGGWGYGTHNGLDWTSTIAIIPWQIYMFYGDSKLLSDCYSNIKSYVDYVERISKDGLTTFGRGDWVPVKSQSNLELTSSVYFYIDTDILAKAAKLFGKEDDYLKYSQLSKKIKDAINNKYLDRNRAIYASGTQTELSVPLQWGVVPAEMKKRVADNLALKVEKAGYHLDVGVLGAKALLNALSENGHVETAYKVAVQNTYPSWGWWVVNGATTLLENWNLDADRDISDNHMMFGEIGAWFFKGLGGIMPDPDQPGFKHIILRPNFVNGLNYSQISHTSPYGTIISEWNRKGKNIIYSVQIPPNSTATFYAPDNIVGERVAVLQAGKHLLKLKMK